MKTITKYIAEDGITFDSQEECKEYEKNKWFIDLWEGTEANGFLSALDKIDGYSGRQVLALLSEYCIITKKPEAPNAKKVLNKGKNH